MLVIPAIDLKDGKCVRLEQGRADAVTEYSSDPVTMAKRWQDEGARRLHVVDLDGAFQGTPVHLKTIENIATVLSIPLEVGGGLRSDEDIRRVLEAGANCAIVGTRAFADPESLAASVASFGEHLAVGIDARDGFVQVKGWVETTSMRAVDLARKADALGVALLVVTDTATDGMLKGTNVSAMAEICEAVHCSVIASGGVSSLEDIRLLKTLQASNLLGAIVGKALYEGNVNFPELQAFADQTQRF